MTTLIFLRHGLSVTNNSGSFTGHLDAPLHERGFTQAQDVAKYFTTQKKYKIDKIYSSPSARAYSTVLPTATALSLPIEKLDALREVNVGNWSGLTFEEVQSRYPAAFQLFRDNVGLARYGDGESSAEAQARMVQTAEKIACENENKTVLIATHGGVLRTLYCAWHNIPLEELKNVNIVPNASISIASYDPQTGKGTFETVGYDEYLTDKTPHIPKYGKDLS